MPQLRRVKLEHPADIAQGDDDLDDEAFSLIDRHTTVDGTLATERDLRVDGQVLGSLQCGGVLFVAQGAEVDATVEAGTIVVSGMLSGTIICHGRLEIRPAGAVHGTVKTGTLVILEGAVYEGQLSMDARRRRRLKQPSSMTRRSRQRSRWRASLKSNLTRIHSCAASRPPRTPRLKRGAGRFAGRH